MTTVINSKQGLSIDHNTENGEVFIRQGWPASDEISEIIIDHSDVEKIINALVNIRDFRK